ncbi:MAG: hypothetical protein KDA89_16045 [Planctomycetaceae bacterium]|nr:hypothetical protein [Planctomycetaceae bacterium]
MTLVGAKNLNHSSVTAELPPVAQETAASPSQPSVGTSRSAHFALSADPSPGLFPMPLTAFEQYMFMDDHPKYPVTFFMQFRLQGRLNLPALVEAYQTAILRHPLLCSRVERCSGRYCWVWSPESVALAELNPDVWRTAKPWLQPINLRAETGVRAWGEVTDKETEITLQFHHACCDGIGASQFLEDIAVCYARRTTVAGPLPELRPLRPEALLTRADPAPRRLGRLGGALVRRLSKMVGDTLDFLFLQWKEVLRPMSGNAIPTEAGEFNLQSEYLDRAATRRLRTAARRANVTLNDILTRDLMKTMEEWNRESGGARRGRLICVLIPASLRGPADDQLPAANVIGYLLLRRRRKEMRDSRQLLTKLSEEMAEYLTAQYGWMFVQALHNVRRIPFLIALSARALKYRCMSTAVLSHMGNRLNSVSSRFRTDGEVIHVGNMTLGEIRCVPPMRYGTNAAAATYIVGGRLMINLRCDPATFGVQQTRQLLERFAARLRQSAEED